MKAAVFYNPNEPLRVEDVPIPRITPQEVLVKIRTCGICRGDLNRINGFVKVDTPFILGHEPAGTIVEVGSEVEGLYAGDEIFMFAVGCGECYYCRIGKDNICDQLVKGFGIGRDGCYAEYAKAYPRECFKLPKGLNWTAGSVLTASTGTTFHAIRLANVSPGDTAVIYGTGCLGTQAIQLLKTMGVRVIAVDIVDEKLDMAQQLGADVVIHALAKDPVKEVKSLTEGRGADIAFEVVGLPKTILQAIDSVRKGGKIVDVGSLSEPFSLKMMPFADEGLALSKELSLMTVSHCSRADMTRLLGLLRIRELDFETGTLKVPLDDINEAFEIKRKGKYLRVVVTP
jgi:propanol-preferring alcohol dehydrogenase